MARPEKINDEKLRLMEELSAIQCTYREIAHLLNVHEDTLHRSKRYSEIIEKGRDKGKIKLRQAMFKSAIGGNVVAQIWLSKQLLGYSEKAIIDNNNRVSLTLNYNLEKTNNKPIQTECISYEKEK